MIIGKTVVKHGQLGVWVPVIFFGNFGGSGGSGQVCFITKEGKGGGGGGKKIPNTSKVFEAI